ncbi:HlyC/CorC family transporter [Nocardioides sp. zg-ZUI104]|uniref:hemolysin family protein n=1 Tax=Nocardioides faecalis TaxID=2803858 RepID=UPI001BCFF226|nr:hemolysin family protein [Nocardioides faecalis]MBS4753119.1 HlyC/CorC family transporter [Nocardioides faecalis]
MSENPLFVITVTAALIVLSALFVAAEFAVLAARRHRIEEKAPTSRSARAALRSFNELTVLLAGCQLGITACALALGAITKPAVHHVLTPAFEDWGVPLWLADGAGFVLALVFVTFLHLVVGEMAPKSWAIAHPETAATVLALPMRAFMWVTRPVLTMLNTIANACLRRVGVEPQDSMATSQTASDLRELVAHSADVGALESGFSSQITDALDLAELSLGDLVETGRELVTVPLSADAAAVQEIAHTSGHLRILIEDAGTVTGVVHVRDTLTAAGSPTPGLAELMRPVLQLDASVPVYEAITTMRETRTHLVLVRTDAGPGVLTLTDLLARLFGQVEAA